MQESQGRGFRKNEGEWTATVDFRKEESFEGRNYELLVLYRGYLNFCVRSSSLRLCNELDLLVRMLIPSTRPVKDACGYNYRVIQRPVQL